MIAYQSYIVKEYYYAGGIDTQNIIKNVATVVLAGGNYDSFILLSEYKLTPFQFDYMTKLYKSNQLTPESVIRTIKYF